MKFKSKKIYAGKSKLHGKGVFAKELIKNNSIITRFYGVIKFKINKNKRDALSHPNWIGVKRHNWIEVKSPQVFINHSCDPNASTKGLTVIAIKEIKKNEEITIDYSLIEGDDRWEMNCSCNESNCRKFIKSVQYLPKQVFEKYLPNVPAYFKKLYINKSLEYEKIRK